MIKKFRRVTALSVLLSVPAVHAGTFYVNQGSANPAPPFANGATAAKNIQEAVNAASAGDEIVVTNGTYGAVSAAKPLLLRSVNGPQVTIIDPAGQTRCASLTNGTRVTGFWLRGGAADVFGGGVFCASSEVFLTNCIITDSVVSTNVNGSMLGSGGGVYGGTLYNCVVASNSAAASGGGAFAATLLNCTVIGNRASSQGGGVYDSRATNCILYYNTSPADPNYGQTPVDHCCAWPMPKSGAGNITNAPNFVNIAKGDLRLVGISLCMDAGDNSKVGTSTDLAGNARIIRGTVDMGAYEFPGTNPVVFYAWVQHHGVRIDGTADFEDPDGDGLNNFEEWICYACPTNALRCLRLTSAVPAGTNMVLRWQSSPGVEYFLERRAKESAQFTVVVSNLVARAGETSYTDTNRPGPGPFVYRVCVSSPYGIVRSRELAP